MKSFIIKLCCCINPVKKHNEPLLTKSPSVSKRQSKFFIDNNANSDSSTDSTIKSNPSPPISPMIDHFLFPLSHYRENEHDIIEYTQTSIISLIDKEFLLMNDYKEFYNKDNMIISIKDSNNLLTDNFPMIKMTYSIPKTSFNNQSLTIPQLISYINNRNKRLKWDKTLKEYKIIEGDEGKGHVLYSWKKSPMIMISERDSVEKKVDFIHNKQFYSFSSSVRDDYIPMIDGVERLVEYFNGYKIFEDEKSFYIRSLSQIDLKVMIPQAMLNMALPTKLREWYRNLVKGINEDGNDDLSH